MDKYSSAPGRVYRPPRHIKTIPRELTVPRTELAHAHSLETGRNILLRLNVYTGDARGTVAGCRE
jgi:hypothetical protein